MAYTNAPRTFTVENKKDRRPMKQKPWSHQSELNSLIGKPIMFKTTLDDYEGVLVAADQFTIKVRITFVEGSQSELTFFKSAIEYFGAI